MSHDDADEVASPCDPCDVAAVETPRQRSWDRVFFAAVAMTALPMSLWYVRAAILYGQRGWPNDHLVAVSSGFLASGCFLISAAAMSLAARLSGFGESHRSRVTRIGSAATVALMTLWGGLLVVGGADQGIFLFVSCVVWACARIFERNRRDQNAVTPLRWLIRTVAATLALLVLAGGASLIFHAVTLYDRLQRKASMPAGQRMPANVPESDAMILGDLCIGIPFVLIGILLLREVFRGFVFFAHSGSSEFDVEAKQMTAA